jgi:putative phosphoribosyl transferase
VDLVPDDSLPVESPVLCLVGSLDSDVIEMNRQTCKKLKNAELKLIPGATHLFEEPGTLEQVARFAAEFCLKYLKAQEE